MRSDYSVVVQEGEEVLFEWQRHNRVDRPQWRQGLPLRCGPWQGQATIWPTREALVQEWLSLPQWTLSAGLGGTLLLTLVTHLALMAMAHARALEEENRERRRIEAALRRSEQTYRTLVENLGQGVFWQDEQGRYVAVNGTFARWVGRSIEAVVGSRDEQLFSAERAARFRRELHEVLDTGQGLESEEAWEDAQGRRIIRRVLRPVQGEDGSCRGVLGLCWDVTELRRLETQLRQASKMDAIGQLAGGIAHDFNNLLTVIIGNLELALQNDRLQQTRRQELEAARTAAERAAALTQRLLTFARNHQLDWRPVVLNPIVADVVEILRRTIDPRIRIETRCDPDLWPVRSDPNQLHQVLMNLCLNARDAITPPGTIIIETARVPAGPRSRRQGLQVVGSDFVRLSVQDTGCGMTEEVQNRIFEPFFTTKQPGKGTGLGLSMVFAIVRQHHGWIECHSRPGQGTRFDIYLPRCPQSEVASASPEEPLGQSESTPTPPGRQAATVLLVDDEEMVRRLARSALEGAGYRVLEAADGQQAIEVFHAHRDTIAVVVLDLTMPQLSGQEVFRQLREIDSHVLVLFASGYAEEQLEHGEQAAMAGFVKKPYRPHELVQAVRRALKHRSQQETKSHTHTWPELDVPTSAAQFQV